MNAVEKRISAQLKADVKRVDADLKKVSTERAKYLKEGDKLTADVNTVWAKLNDGSTEHGDALVAAFTRLQRLAREVSTLNAKAASLAEQKAKLTAEGEMARRVELAQKLGVGDEPMSGPAAAKAVLLYRGKPMRVEEITRDMLEAGTVKLNGRTPVATVSAYLAKAAKKDDTFVRIAPGTFNLKAEKPAKATKAAKAEPETAEPEPVKS